MRFGAGLEVEELADGVRVRARDWPYALWLGVPLLAIGLPLLAWSALEGHAVELGGALVFVGLGGTCAWLALVERRGVELRRDGERVRLTAVEGAGPFERVVEREIEGEVAVEVEPFARPDGAPELPDRGADLVLEASGFRYRLVRAAGPRTADLGAARERILAALSVGPTR